MDYRHIEVNCDSKTPLLLGDVAIIVTRFSNHDLDFPLDLPVDPGPSPEGRYFDLLVSTRHLYQSAAKKIITEHAELVSKPDQFADLMDDLHRGLVLKTYCLVCEADNEWSSGEQDLAEALAVHLWNRKLTGNSLKVAMREASDKASRLEWLSLLRPFQELPPLFDQIAALETLLIRQANQIARIDGNLKESEQQAIQQLTFELQRHLGDLNQLSNEADHDKLPDLIASDMAFASEEMSLDGKPSTSGVDSNKTSTLGNRTIDEVLADLDTLIGLDAIKHEVRSLINYLSLQNKREAAGLPKTDIGLHLVFAGNPGTGKTTVARLIGEAFQAMGILAKGHMIETDRSGLVAEYAGQTAVKTNKRIDEALDGVLFVDEAYGLVASNHDDPYGNEAVQTLLKRAEDDRHRLAVILAGYPNEMSDLLQSNPGLQSRFNKTLQFEDYSPIELCKIFGCLLESHYYRITPEGRLKVISLLTEQHKTKDQGYGNGREVRNLFEHTILRMANRLADMPSITEQQLVTFVEEDFQLDQEPCFDSSLVRVQCPSCEHQSSGPSRLLGARVSCPKCGETFHADWCEIINKKSS